MELSAVGYEKKEVKIASGQTMVEINLSMSYVLTGEVVIVRKRRTKKKAATKEQAVCPTQEPVSSNKPLTIYPNPVMAGATVNLTWRLNQPGDYKLELIDVKGYTVHTQLLVGLQAGQAIAFATHSQWAKGSYWVRIYQAGDKKVYIAQMLLQ